MNNFVCKICEKERPIIKRPKNGDSVCKSCFYFCFEEEIHQTIVKGKLFKRNDRVAVASSGGKDSTVLGYVLKLLNERYDYGLELILLSIDEGITGYRDDSLESVKRNQQDYNLPLTILTYKDIYGWTMDDIVKQIGLKNNCTFCGVFRRQALDRGALNLKCDCIVTGHNADDLAETILMNLLRGDIARLKRSVNITTSTDNKRSKGESDKEINEFNQNNERTECCTEDARQTDEFTNKAGKQTTDNEQTDLTSGREAGTCCGQNNECMGKTIFKSSIGILPRCKPFKYTYEKEIVMYAHFKKLDYFSTECIYSPNSYRGHARAFLKELEVIRPSVIIDIIHSGECLLVRDTLTLPKQGVCVRCGYISSQNICKACVMLEGLNKGQPRLGIGKSSKVDLIKLVNNKKVFCRKEQCDCDGEHYNDRTSKRQMKRMQKLADRERDIQKRDGDESIKQDVNKFMHNLSLKE